MAGHMAYLSRKCPMSNRYHKVWTPPITETSTMQTKGRVPELFTTLYYIL